MPNSILLTPSQRKYLKIIDEGTPVIIGRCSINPDTDKDTFPHGIRWIRYLATNERIHIRSITALLRKGLIEPHGRHMKHGSPHYYFRVTEAGLLKLEDGRQTRWAEAPPEIDLTPLPPVAALKEYEEIGPKDYPKMPRRHAAELALTIYFTGKKCKNGHLYPRRTSTGHCIICQGIEARKAGAKRPPERRRSYDREVYLKRKERVEKFKEKLDKQRHADNERRILEGLPPILKRSEALERGFTEYVDGKECKYGHTGPRYTANGRCVECHSLVMQKRFEKNKSNPRYGETFEPKKRSGPRDKVLDFGGGLD